MNSTRGISAQDITLSMAEEGMIGAGFGAPHHRSSAARPAAKADTGRNANIHSARGSLPYARPERDCLPVAGDRERSDPLLYPSASDGDYEKKYAPDAYGEELDSTARVWRVYNDERQIVDGEMVKGLNGTLDVLLVFAGLFSAVVTTFVAQSSQALSPDYAQITASLVYELVRIQRAVVAGSEGAIPSSRLSFDSVTTQGTDIWINGLWLVSLSLSLLTALVAVLAKQWIQYYSSSPGGPPHDRAALRQYRFDGFQYWKVPAIIGLLPGLLTIALLLFLAGLAVYVAPLNSTIFVVTTCISAAALILYAATILLPIVVAHCAYKTPVSDYLAFFILRAFNFLSLALTTAWDFVHCRTPDFADISFITGSHLRSRELSDAVRKRDDLLQGMLNWLARSSLNESAARVAVQAASAAAVGTDPDRLLACFARSSAYSQALTRDYEASRTLTPEQAIFAERLARLTLHAEYYLLFEIWSFSFWAHMYAYWAQINSPAHEALICIAFWIHFCSEKDALLNRSAVRRTLDACYLIDFSVSGPKLHPVVWLELDRLARACLYVCSKTHTHSNSVDWDGDERVTQFRAHWIRQDIIAAEHHPHYTPPRNMMNPYGSTAITLNEYCKGCQWGEGQEEMLNNLEMLKHMLSERLAELELEGTEHPGRANDASRQENRIPHAAVAQVEELGDVTPADVPFDDHGESGCSVEHRDDACNDREKRHATDNDVERRPSSAGTDYSAQAAESAPSHESARTGLGVVEIEIARGDQRGAAVKADAAHMERREGQGREQRRHVRDVSSRDEEAFVVLQERLAQADEAAASTVEAPDIIGSSDASNWSDYTPASANEARRGDVDLGVHSPAPELGGQQPATGGAVGSARTCATNASAGVPAAGLGMNDVPEGSLSAVGAGEGVKDDSDGRGRAIDAPDDAPTVCTEPGQTEEGYGGKGHNREGEGRRGTREAVDSLTPSQSSFAATQEAHYELPGAQSSGSFEDRGQSAAADVGDRSRRQRTAEETMRGTGEES